MRILGIDCGLSETGYAFLIDGCLVKSGVISTGKELNIADRIGLIYDGIKEVVHLERPDISVIETIYGGKNIKTLIYLAHVRGSILLATLDTKIYEASPAEIKKAVTGNGRASKQQVRYMVEKFLDITKGLSEHVIDACACALWGEWRIRDQVPGR